MGETHVNTQKPTRRGELGRLSPRSFTGETREREFHRDRRRGYLAEIEGPPSARQAELIDLKITAEWNALKLEAEIKTREAETGKIDVVNRKLAIAYRSQAAQHGRDLDWTMSPRRGRWPASVAASAPSPASETLSQAAVKSEPVEPELPFPSTRRPKRYRDHATGR